MMKKASKVSGVILIIGIVLLAVGLLNNGNQPVGADNGYSPWHTLKHKSVTRSYKVNKFKQINLDLFMPNIHIHSGSRYQVVVSGPNAKTIKVSSTDQQLTITDTNQHSFSGINWHYLNSRINVTVPDKNALKKITGSCAEGDLELKDLKIDQIDLQLSDGDANLSGIVAKEARLDLNDGDIKISDSTLSTGTLTVEDGDVAIRNSKFKLAANLADGDTTISNSRLLGNSSFKLDDGDFAMDNSQKLSYDLAANSDNKLTVQGHDYDKSYSKKTRGTLQLKVTCDDGNISIS